jgi:hypothetical protein
MIISIKEIEYYVSWEGLLRQNASALPAMLRTTVRRTGKKIEDSIMER